jgi:ubiquinone/menaquinone biosynthesis C-methylase UbiE
MRNKPNATFRVGQFGPDVYADWRISSLGEITEALEHRLIFQLVGTLQGRSVLDVGCGDGTLALACAGSGAARVTACDPDPRMVARARARAICGDANIDLAVARSQALPFPDNCFDVVTCITVLAFVPDADNAIREMARVVRPGGRLVIGDLGKWSLWAARRRIRGWFGAKMWQAARFRTAKELAAMAEGAGLTVGSIKGAIFFPPWKTLARVIAPLDPPMGEITTMGAAFVAVLAAKPYCSPVKN